jgi:hypothetical protein
MNILLVMRLVLNLHLIKLTYMKSLVTLFLLLASVFASDAQLAVYRVIVLNEGHYDYVNNVQTVPVSIGTYNPATKLYQQFDAIDSARFATCVLVDDASIYAAADSLIIRYDKNTYQEMARVVYRGVRKLALWNNQLLATRGEYLMTFSSYFDVFDKSSLSHIYSLPVTGGPQYSTEGVVVKDNMAYVGVGNGFEWGNEKGLIGVVDLTAQTYTLEIDLGPMGTNPEYMGLKGNELFTLNNRDYSNSSISSVDLGTGTPTTYDLSITSGCGTSLLAASDMYYQPSADMSLRHFSTTSYSTVGTLPINQSLYGMAYDEINNLIYAGVTDYTTSGKVFIYDMTGAAIDSFDVSVSPGNIAFDTRDPASVSEINALMNVSVYPNPVADNLFVSSTLSSDLRYSVTDVAGKVVAFGKIISNILNVAALNAGSYFIRIDNGSESVNKRFIKF